MNASKQAVKKLRAEVRDLKEICIKEGTIPGPGITRQSWKRRIVGAEIAKPLSQDRLHEPSTKGTKGTKETKRMKRTDSKRRIGAARLKYGKSVTKAIAKYMKRRSRK